MDTNYMCFSVRMVMSFCRITVGSYQDIGKATVESFVGEIAETFNSFYCCIGFVKWIVFQP